MSLFIPAYPGFLLALPIQGLDVRAPMCHGRKERAAERFSAAE